MSINNGVQVDVASFADVGSAAGSTGEVTVDGSQSSWQIGRTLTIGADGTGSLDIINGGSVTAVETIIGTGNAPYNGSVFVDGAGSNLSLPDGDFDILVVGSSSAGTLTITNGAMVSAGEAFAGDATTGMGTVLLDGIGSAWTASPVAHCP